MASTYASTQLYILVLTNDVRIEGKVYVCSSLFSLRDSWQRIFWGVGFEFRLCSF